MYRTSRAWGSWREWDFTFEGMSQIKGAAVCKSWYQEEEGRFRIDLKAKLCC